MDKGVIQRGFGRTSFDVRKISVLCTCKGSGYEEDIEFGTGRKVLVVCSGCDGLGYTEAREVTNADVDAKPEANQVVR